MILLEYHVKTYLAYVCLIHGHIRARKRQSPHGIAGKGDRTMVLIDIPMPRNCEECPVINADGDCPFYPKDDQVDTFREQYRRCPLKEVQT